MGGQTSLEVDVIDTIQDADRDQWNQVVERTKQGTVFHRYGWLAAIESGIEYPARHLLVVKDQNVIGIWPNFVADFYDTPLLRLTSMTPGFGGPLATTDVKDSISLFAEAVPDVCSGRTVVHEVRMKEMDNIRYDTLLKTNGYRLTRDGCRFLLDLSRGYDEIWDEMSRNRRKGIERGREEDYEVVEEEITLANLSRFYGTYRRVMNRIGSDGFPLSFLKQLREMEDRILLLTLRINGEYAGGALEVLNDEQSSVHGFIMAVPQTYFEYHASELLYDHVIQWGIENGYETYDLGYTPADFEDGLFRFKESFGGRIEPTLFWERGCSPVWPLVDAGRNVYWSYWK